MPGTGTTYPPASPSVTGDKVTVSRWLKSPTLQFKTFERLTGQQFIADFIFRQGQANGGAVIFDKLLEANLYPTGEPAEVAPGTSFPLVNVDDPDPKVALAVERGYAFLTTYVAERRNTMSVIQKGARRLGNGMVRDHNAVAVNAFFSDSDIPSGPAETDWDASTGKGMIADIRSAISEIKNGDLGYTVDTALIHPDVELLLLNDEWITEHLPRENAGVNPLLSNELAGLAGIKNWVVSHRVPADKVGITSKGAVGSINIEEGLWSKTIDDPVNRRHITQAGRSDVPVIDEPLAAFILDIEE